MKVPFSYGQNGLLIELPDNTDVLTTKFIPGLSNINTTIREALQKPINSKPLSSLVKPGNKVAITHTDITRATPNDCILPIILSELEKAGISRNDITLINSLGTHRPQSEQELRKMLGDYVVDNYRCYQHDAYDDSNLVLIGKTKFGNPVRINKTFIDADFRIVTGFIEPHFFAGFSGGPKGILPAIAGAESVHTNHSKHMIGNSKSTWGVTSGNPVWEEMVEAALFVEPFFLFNVALNNHHEVTGIFCGNFIQAHSAGTAFVHSNSMVEVELPYDIVVTSNSGYPLDQNLYQTVKGMSAANQIVKNGGSIIMVAACVDGLPDHGNYASLLAQVNSPKELLDLLAQSNNSIQDQWQVHIQALIQMRSSVYVYSKGLTNKQIEKAHLIPCRNVELTIRELMNRHGPNCRICAMPEGPHLIPVLSTKQHHGFVSEISIP